MATEHRSIVIVGAGLSGLYAAWQLQQKKCTCIRGAKPYRWSNLVTIN
ncbi:MAG TPA: hypothetical protein DD827_03030 [Gammaproteobacteria bacterium]|nr:hypothetical protein [Gammaproteobacteria bacterium]